MRLSPPILTLLLTAVAVGFTGCSRPPPKSVYVVNGTLLVGDVPAANASLAFHPLGKRTSTICPVAMTRRDGSFRLTTYATGDGAPAGEYVVTVVWPDETKPFDECECPDPAQHDRLRGMYADRAKSPLRATIRPEQNELTLQTTDIEVLLEKMTSQAERE